MAFSVSNIVDAVNNYLYSISDVNKLLTEGETTNKTSGLSGIFQKYLNKAVEDTNAGNKNTSTLVDLDSLTDADVLNTLVSLNGLATSSAFDTTSSSSNATGLNALTASTLPDLLNGTGTSSSKIDYTELATSLSEALKGNTSASQTASNKANTASGKTYTASGATAKVDGSVAPATKVSDNSMANLITSEITDRFANMDLESKIKQPFQNLDLKSEINQAFRNVDVNAVFDEAFRGIDLGAEIEKSIGSHNKINEAVSYNESRLQAYKRSGKTAAETSTFGDFRL